jgi:hypothetical protein
MQARITERGHDHHHEGDAGRIDEDLAAAVARLSESQVSLLTIVNHLSSRLKAVEAHVWRKEAKT